MLTNLILLPVKPLHLVLLQLQPCLHILIIITRVRLQFPAVHVNDVSADAVQKALGMGHEDQDALKTAKPKTQSGRCRSATAS